MSVLVRTKNRLSKRAMLLSMTIIGFFVLITILLTQGDLLDKKFPIRLSVIGLSHNKSSNSTMLSADKESFRQTNSINELANQPENRIKIILHWNNWNASMGYEAYEPLLQTTCPATACMFTPDRSLLNISDVILFSFDNETSPIHPLPTYRQPHQRFVFVTSQSPVFTTDVLESENNQWLNYFNWTMTKRLDSDIVFRDALGTFIPLTTRHTAFPHNKKVPFKGSSSSWMTRPSKRLRGVSRIGDKKKLVAWFPSQCITSVRREDYVRQLSQYIPIDIYGKCGNLTCPNTNCFDMLRSQYKFYLTFEESWCPDHVTTEFYKVLDSDTVPVVLGGVDYDTLGPPHSFINVLDFPSLKSLADYLLFLDKTPEMYARYFDWKKTFEILLKPVDGWCDLCRSLHDSNLPEKVYDDIRKWWVDDKQCQSKLHF